MTLIIQMEKLYFREAKANIFYYIRSLHVQNLERQRAPLTVEMTICCHYCLKDDSRELLNPGQTSSQTILPFFLLIFSKESCRREQGSTEQ